MLDQQVPIKPRPWLTGWRPVAVDGALVACLLALSAPVIITGTLAARALQVAVALATTLPLVVRRRWPLTVFAAVALAAFGQWLGRITLRPHDLAVLVALYTVAAYHTRRWAVAALGVCVFGAVLEWWQVAPRTDYNPAGLLAPLVVVTATWVLGSTLRTRRACLVELEERAVRLERERDAQARAAVAEERARIAREMHDMVAHRVGVIVAQADGATYVFDTAPDQARAALKVIADSARAALTEMRRLLGVLRDDQEQAIAPQPGIADIDRLVSDLRTSGLPVRYTVDGATSELEPGLALTVYRVVQESLTNTLKHAGPATPTAVVVRQRPDAVEVQVADEGPSAEASSTGSPVPVSNGHGLVGMAERVAMYGGTLHAAPRAGGGWRVDVVVPTGGVVGDGHR